MQIPISRPCPREQHAERVSDKKFWWKKKLFRFRWEFFGYVSKDFKDFSYLEILKKKMCDKKIIRMFWNVFWSKFHQNRSRNGVYRMADPTNTKYKFKLFGRKIFFQPHMVLSKSVRLKAFASHELLQQWKM